MSGTSKQYVRVGDGDGDGDGDGGGRGTFRFCPECGATVFYTVHGREGDIMIPVGAFADPSFPGPTFSVYEQRMHSWVQMTVDIERMN